MRKNAHFRGYNDVPWFIKEAIGWPDHYDNLSTEQIRDDLEEIIEDL